MPHGAPQPKRYTLFLVNPRLVHKHYGAGQELSRLLGKKKISVPLALPLIAALTPEHYDVHIIDDETDAIPAEPRPDLVAFTTAVSNVDRAYDLARPFRDIPVVMGGTYATFEPDQVLEHADVVVIGEAEGTWRRLLGDFEQGRLERTYRAAEPADLDQAVPPRWDLVNVSEVITLGVETSRGCPYNCEFCLVNKVFGRRMRYREIDQVIREIQALPSKNLFFVDDNLTINKPRARELMRRLAPLGLSWVCQCSIDVASDAELLAAMAQAGCLSMLVGFESLSPESLRETKKHHNRVQEYAAAVRNVQAHGIHVIASFVVGFDADTLESFEHIARFVEDNDVLYTMLSILAAAPGTDIWDRMKAEGRLCYPGLEFITGILPCMQYRAMSQLEMLDRYVATLERVYDPDSLRRRALRLFGTGSFRQPSSGDVPLRDKVSATLKMLERYLLRGSRAKRRLFVDLVRLGIRGQVAMDRVVVLLLQLESTFAFLESFRRELPKIRALVAAVDPGPVDARGSAAFATAPPPPPT
jgi:radical SAM superfamily enzyme YgiQ (UPF0313 family)